MVLTEVPGRLSELTEVPALWAASVTQGYLAVFGTIGIITNLHRRCRAGQAAKRAVKVTRIVKCSTSVILVYLPGKHAIAVDAQMA